MPQLCKQSRQKKGSDEPCQEGGESYQRRFTMQLYGFDKRLDAFPEVARYKSFDVEPFTRTIDETPAI